MPLSAAERAAWAQQAYGCSEADLEQAVARAADLYTDELMLAMSILSDAQEVIARGDRETGRQFINRAKWVIGRVRERTRGTER